MIGGGDADDDDAGCDVDDVEPIGRSPPHRLCLDSYTESQGLCSQGLLIAASYVYSPYALG